MEATSTANGAIEVASLDEIGVEERESQLRLRPRLRAPGRRAHGAAELGRSSPDAALMQRLCEGDAGAFEQLVDRHKNGLINYLTKLTRCRDRAEEIAQEAFLRVYQTSHRYREKGLFSAYLFRIATNLVRSEERRKARWRNLAGMLAHDRPARGRTPQGLALSGEVAEIVTGALAELPLHYRAPVVLREIEGWSYSEIAAALGCREGTVKSRINRAKARLRERLRTYWEGGVG